MTNFLSIVSIFLQSIFETVSGPLKVRSKGRQTLSGTKLSRQETACLADFQKATQGFFKGFQENFFLFLRMFSFLKSNIDRPLKSAKIFR